MRGRDGFFLWWKFLLENQLELRIDTNKALLNMRETWPCQFLEPMRCSLSGCKVIHPKIVCKGKDPSGEHGHVLYKTLQWSQGDWTEAINEWNKGWACQLWPVSRIYIGINRLRGIQIKCTRPYISEYMMLITAWKPGSSLSQKNSTQRRCISSLLRMKPTRARQSSWTALANWNRVLGIHMQVQSKTHSSLF